MHYWKEVIQKDFLNDCDHTDLIVLSVLEPSDREKRAKYINSEFSIPC